MRFRFLLISFLFSLSVTFAQTVTPTFQVPLTGQITGDYGVLSGVQIQLYEGSKLVNTYFTDIGGNYGFDLALNKDFTVVLSKPGMANKKFTISTRGIPPERAQTKFGIIEANVGLFEKLDGVDYSVLEQPANKFIYNPNKETFEYDKAYLESMLGRMDALRAQIEQVKKKEKEAEANYLATVKAGDKAFGKKDWAGAKAAYNQALTMKPKESYPKDQITNIDKIIAEQEALNKKKAEEEKKAAEEAAKKKEEENLNNKYLAALKKGDDAFAKKDWVNAKAGYNEALTTKPAEQLPKDKLAQVDKAIADEAAAKKKAEEDAAKAKADAELNAKYTAAIKKGDDAFAAKDWNNAKAGYTEATGLKPTEQYPKDKLAAVDKAIADDAAAKAKADADAKAKAETEAKYTAAIKKGDDAFAKKDWATAKAGYNEAIGIKAAEKYPKDQLVAVDKAIADEAAAKKKADEEAAKAKADAELNAKYNAAFKKGEDAFAKKDWPNAKAAFTEASGIKPSEQAPKDRLAAIDKAIADEAAAKAKADADAKAKAELDAKYAAAIKKGDDAFAKKDWTNARAGYNEALGFKSAEQYPKDKIAAIDKAMGDEAAAKAKADADAKAKAELDAKYAAAIKKGDEGFAKKDWPNAKAGYQEALGLKSTEKYPKDQIAIIDKAIADDAAAKAKADADAKAKADLEAKYTAAVKKGDDAFAKKDWATSRAGYNEALSVKAAEKYPKDQLAAIDKAIADEKSKMDADAKAKAEAELNAKYQDAVKKGDDAFAAKDWATSRSSYNQALGFKPAEKYPKDQLAAIDKAIADEKAKMDADAKAKAEAELNAKYQDAVKKGDDAFAKKDYAGARSSYNQALGFKPAEKYPKDQLAAIDKAMGEEAANKAKADAEAKAKAEVEAKYNAAIKKGDDAFAKKDWTTSRGGYTEALAIKAGEKYPTDQLAAIEKAIADEKSKMDADAKAKAEAELNAKYTAAIKKGDDAFAKKDWTTSRTGYNEAIGIKPSESYPKDQLKAIDKAIEDEKLKMDAASKAKAEAELTAKYTAAVKKGDDAFAKKDWAGSRAGYNEAIGIKPSEQYPKDQLKAIDKAIEDEKLKMDAAAKAKAEAEVNAKYTAAIKKADDAFGKKDWNAAKAGYNEAISIKPSESYPKDQLTAIDKAIADEKSKMDAASKAKAEAELNAKYAAAIKKADDAFAKKDWNNAKSAYTEASGIKPSEKYPKDQLAAIDKAISDAVGIKTNNNGVVKQDNINSKNDGSIKPVLGGTDQKYKDAIKNADDNFKMKQWKTAKGFYEEAMTHKSGDAYAKGKLIEIERILNSDEPNDRIKALLAKYAPGVTEETITGDGVVIIQRVVVKDQMAWVYQKKIFSWGGIAFFRDNSTITELTYESETKP
jgi:hypothetical protein